MEVRLRSVLTQIFILGPAHTASSTNLIISGELSKHVCLASGIIDLSRLLKYIRVAKPPPPFLQYNIKWLSNARCGIP